MRKSVLILIAAVVIDLPASQSARAADIVPRGYPPPAPAPVYAPPISWTGCYVGGNIGGAWSNVDFSGVSGVNFSASNSGFAGGGQIGCDYQWNQFWVVGIRNMLDATSLSNRTNISAVPFTGAVDSRTRWFDTLTARVGYLVPSTNVLLYAQGGAAWTNTSITFLDGSGAQLGEASNDRTGWTVGAGVEWRFAPQWSVFAEYNFMGFGTQSATFTGCGGTCVVNASAKADVQNVLAGVNYKFNF
ncbi:MAG: outer membrane beta-barrel protein [Xanthobacteraceae bacterium]|jgi:outer membrane immunogenic protein